MREAPFAFLPAARQKASWWSAWLRWRARRRGAELTPAVFGAGWPWPAVKHLGRRLVLGRVFLAPGVRLLTEHDGELYIGDDTVLDAGCEIFAWARVTIGRGCYLGWETLVMDTDQHRVGDRPLVNKPVAIGDRVAIGARALVLKGVTIGDDAVIQPGSIVTHDVPAGGEVRPRLATVIGHLALPGAPSGGRPSGTPSSQPAPGQPEDYPR